MQEIRDFLVSRGLPRGDAYDLPTSPKRFPDGAQYRVEIPSVEGPRALAAVLEEAERQRVLIQRVSQGSGVMLLTDAEIREMVKLGHEAGIEVSLFVGPRAGWEPSAQVAASAGKNLGARHRGMDQVIYAAEDIRRACGLGIRSVLVADEGLLWLAAELKRAGKLPADLVLKVSVQMAAANPISIRWMGQLGAGPYSVPTALTLPQLAAIRQAVSLPLDVYVEAPDDFGGFVRHYEVPEMVRVAAPMYVKLGLRNAPNIYPSGMHVENTAVAMARERVHRAAIAVEMIRRYYPEAVTSPRGAADLGIPVL
ncbi:MAG: U32 family peptidase [Anaerolineae bacterium]|nr:U32 family peptidase [Anaerolineae bacterium]